MANLSSIWLEARCRVLGRASVPTDQEGDREILLRTWEASICIFANT